MTAPAPGWYPAPGEEAEGIARWWDGAAWTEHRASAPPSLTPVAPQPPISASSHPGNFVAQHAATDQATPNTLRHLAQGTDSGSATAPTPEVTELKFGEDAPRVAPAPTSSNQLSTSGTPAASSSFMPPVAAAIDARGPIRRAVSDGLRLVFKWSGRASRADFWLLYAFQVLVGTGVAVLAGVGLPLILMAQLESAIANSDAKPSVLLTVGVFVMFGLLTILETYLGIASWGAFVRRLHDIGRSGWYSLVALVPVAGLVFTIIWGVAEPVGRNNWGDPA